MAKAKTFTTPGPTGKGVVGALARWRKDTLSGGVDWADVSAVSLKAAISVCVAQRISLQFSQAQGGRGVCITLWDGTSQEREYAVDAEEVSQLLDQLVEAFGSPAEDVIASMGGTT